MHQSNPGEACETGKLQIKKISIVALFQCSWFGQSWAYVTDRSTSACCKWPSGSARRHRARTGGGDSRRDAIPLHIVQLPRGLISEWRGRSAPVVFKDNGRTSRPRFTNRGSGGVHSFAKPLTATRRTPSHILISTPVSLVYLDRLKILGSNLQRCFRLMYLFVCLQYPSTDRVTVLLCDGTLTTIEQRVMHGHAVAVFRGWPISYRHLLILGPIIKRHHWASALNTLHLC